jgi:hypothetical protein
LGDIKEMGEYWKLQEKALEWEDTANCKRKHWNALCAELAVEGGYGQERSQTVG